ncbi:hypothetical protein [Deinococcus depolymerans]|uniref:Uncharacterized protein n=1 Tax=Deinococcus depolymerans TaxID=392408 RepID=A0ABP3LX19_9DEIO
MKDKIRRILDLIRAARLTLDDAAPLLAALHTRLALQTTDRELLAALLNREELSTDQIAEQLMLLRGVPAVPTAPQAPRPPRPPQAPAAPRRPQVVIGGQRVRGLEDLVERFADRFTGGIDEMVDRITQQAVPHDPVPPEPHMPRASARILRIEIESSDGDEYSANLPVSLAAHLPKLIPPHGVRALEAAGLSIEALQLIIEADPPPGPLIDSEDSSGNEIRISLK